MKRINPFDWGREFAAIMSAGGFDVVIGNPPYLNIDDTWGKKDIRLHLIKTSYPDVYSDKTDILFYFLARATLLSRGSVSFIVSRAFLEAYKANRLRAFLLKHTRIESIVDFQNFHVFKKAGITTCIITLRTRQPGADITAAKLRGSLPEPYDVDVALRNTSAFRSINFPQARLSAAPWNFTSADVGQLNAKIDAAGSRLDLVLKLGQGMQTGRNDVFGERKEAEILEWGVPGSLTFKRATNSDIEKYFIHDRREYILYLEDVESFSDLPSAVQDYLRKHEKVLKERAAFRRGDCEWWKYTWPLHQEWYGRTRILCPYLAQVNRFALDDAREFLGLTDTTVLFDDGQPENLLYIVALLNSGLLTFRFRTIGKLKSGGIYEYFWNSISRLPIRRIDFANVREVQRHDEIVSAAQRLQKAIAAQQRARDPYERRRREREVALLDGEIEKRVRSLYGITSTEESLIEEELIETTLQKAL